jgi:hypothetical protein
MTRREHLHSELTQEEKRRVQRDTLYGRAVAEQGTIQGRFATREQSTVIGSGPVEYPALPPNSPWHHNPLPAEEPLGVDINAAEPVGTHAEIAKSLREARDGADPPSASLPDSPNDEGRAPLGGLLADASRRPRRLSKRKKV